MILISSILLRPSDSRFQGGDQYQAPDVASLWANMGDSSAPEPTSVGDIGGGSDVGASRGLSRKSAESAPISRRRRRTSTQSHLSVQPTAH